MKLKKYLIVIFSSVFYSQCSHMQSGQYIQLISGETIEDLSKEFKVPPGEILNANKNISFTRGSWVFIPLKRGVMAHVSQKRIYSNINYNAENFWSSKLLWPIPDNFTISSAFGRRGNRPHHGIDIKAKVGDSIIASDDGVVIYSGNKLKGYGNLTIIYHGDDLYTVYAHAQKNFTKKGQHVYRGQVISTVGMTGRTTGPHLHFEVREGHKAVKPLEYLSR